MVLQDGIMLANRINIVEFANTKGLPSVYQIREYPEAGGLMSYGLNYCQHFRRAAFYVDKVLKGVQPSELPVELPTTFELVINRKTAQRLDLAIPDRIVAVADEVME